MSGVTRLHFDFEWRITLFTLLLLPLLVGLGCWQLQRAGEKRELAAMFEVRQAQAPVPVTALWGESPEALAYRPARARGTFDSQRYLLLDNRVSRGRFGYEVVAILHLSDRDATVLVNRGWVAGDPARRSLPEVNWPRGEQTVSGSVYVAPGKPYLLGPQALDGDWPLVVQSLAAEGMVSTLERRLGQAVWPWSLRIDPAEPGALAADWPLVNTSPAKHTGYAVQWFCMALALLMLFVLRSSNLWQWLRGQPDPEN
ncbi:MAG: SURF1 family protein [Parahaliea sp.]